MSSHIKYANNSIQFYINNILIEEVQSDQAHTPNSTYLKFNPSTLNTEYWVNGEKLRETN